MKKYILCIVAFGKCHTSFLVSSMNCAKEEVGAVRTRQLLKNCVFRATFHAVAKRNYTYILLQPTYLAR